MALFKHEMETKLKRSEEKYRTLAENARDIIFIIGLDDRVKYVNNFAAKLLGLKPEEILGKSRKNFFPMDVSDKQRLELDKTVQKNTSIS